MHPCITSWKRCLSRLAPRLSCTAHRLVLHRDGGPHQLPSTAAIVGHDEARSPTPELGQERRCTPWQTTKMMAGRPLEKLYSQIGDEGGREESLTEDFVITESSPEL